MMLFCRYVSGLPFPQRVVNWTSILASDLYYRSLLLGGRSTETVESLHTAQYQDHHTAASIHGCIVFSAAASSFMSVFFLIPFFQSLLAFLQIFL